MPTPRARTTTPHHGRREGPPSNPPPTERRGPLTLGPRRHLALASPGFSRARRLRDATAGRPRHAQHLLHRAARRGAFTLFEALLASVILALCVLPFSQAILAGYTESSTAGRVQRAVRLDEEMMERILASTYANLSTYSGQTEARGNVRDAAGNLYPSDYQGFTRVVTVQTGNLTVAGLGGTISGTTVTVTVTDSNSQGGTWAIKRFIPHP